MKYYYVSAFLIEKEDVFDKRLSITGNTVEARPDNTVTFIATKILGRYKEIKTGKIIPNVWMSGSMPLNKNEIVHLDEKSLKKIDKTGAVLVTSNLCEGLIRPVTNPDEVKDYLKKDVAREAFKKLDAIRSNSVSKKIVNIEPLNSLKNEVTEKNITEKEEPKMSSSVKKVENKKNR